MGDLRIGELLVRNNLITDVQLAEALTQRQNYPNKTLGQVICQLGYLRKSDLDTILDHYRKREKLGDILIKQKIIDEGKLNHALAISIREGKLLGETLIKLNYIDEHQLAHCIATQYDLPFVSLKNVYLSRDLALHINASYAFRHKIVPISQLGRSVTFAMAFPLDKQLLREIEMAANVTVIPVIAMASEIVQAQRSIYLRPARLDRQGREELQIELCESTPREKGKNRSMDEANSPETERALRKLIAVGIKARASDIHLESLESGMMVRFRIDGMLQTIDLGEEKGMISSRSQAIISKIKVLCDMDIAEKRRPQDGSFRMRVASDETVRIVDFRVSTLPTGSTEDVVIRILDRGGLPLSLEMLGFSRPYVEAIHGALLTPAGIFLVTGPTGCGKSATLHALLARLNKPGLKSLSIEDPIEYTMEGVRQTEVNESVGNTFSRMLRSFMRQDPDNIMIGEIRDPESAGLAIGAALTGHTVMSSLQANDATSAVTRLLDMGIDPSFLASSLRGIIAQRLVRIVCPACRETYAPPPHVLDRFHIPPQTSVGFVHGRGCPACNFSGYNGRRPITELWIPTAEELLHIYQRPDNLFLRELVFVAGGRPTMMVDGIGRVKNGETTLEELLRVAPYAQLAELDKLAENNAFHWGD